MLSVALISAGLAFSYALFLVMAPPDWFSMANQVGPILLLVTCLWGAYRTMKNTPLALMTPMPWFLVACAAYFGFAPLVYHFGSAESISYTDTFFPVDEVSLLRTNLLNAVGIAIVLTGFFLGKLVLARKLSLRSRSRQFNHTEMLRLMLFFVVTGLSVKYLFAFPYYMGWISWTLPGGIQWLSTFSKIAIILLFVLIRHGFWRSKWLLYGLIGEELIVAMMTLSKLAVIEVFVAIGLGWYLSRRPSIRALAMSGVGLVLLYVLILSPFVSYARLIAGSVGVGSVVEVSESAMGFSRGARSDDIADIIPGIQGWWTRLSYSNAQAFALDDYDNGKGGETIGLITYAFVPRLLYSDKPIMTPGREFTEKITGQVSETATAAGFFAEAYWNGGWILVIFACLFVGLIFFGFTIFADRIIAAARYEYLPIAMIGISMGYSPTDWIVSTYVGPLANAIVFYAVMRYFVMPIIRVPQKLNAPNARLDNS